MPCTGSLPVSSQTAVSFLMGAKTGCPWIPTLWKTSANRYSKGYAMALFLS